MEQVVYEKPRSEDTARIIKAGLANKNTIIIIGECRVDYEGRGASRLEPGERIVIIKQDGAVLVHRPFGYSPVNWQPSASVIEVVYRDGIGLIIHAVRNKPREYLTIVFTSVELVICSRLNDTGDFTMYADEREVRDVILDNPSLIENGLRVLSIEKQIGDGYVDIYAVDKENKYVLIELKRITATRESVMQLYKYIEQFKNEYGSTPRGVLVAPAFSPTALELAYRLGIEYRYIDLKKIWENLKNKQIKKKTILEYTKGSNIDTPG
ncbi:MAG: endonuclease NucS [Desulfurococcaceae archaeon]